jgi:2,6-dihydroxypseudooxynicotine hydrolase
VEINNQVQTNEMFSFGQIMGANTNVHNEQTSFTSFCLRLLNFGISYSDLERIRSTSIDWMTFSRAMGNLARQWKKSAERAWKLGRLATPREQWKRAADYFHYAQLNLPESLLKKSFQRATHACYQQAAELLDPPAIRCQVPFESGHFPGYLRIRRPGAACVILIGDLDSAKEVELHYLAEMFLRRSCSVFYFDGPGQGELSGKGSIACGFERVVSSVIDFLRHDSRVGVTSIGCFGIGLGGHLACRAAACDPRIDACISVSGFFDSGVLHNLPPVTQSKFLDAFGFPADHNIGQLNPHVTLAPLKGQMKAPLLLVHGAADHLVGMEQVRALQKWACGPVETLVLESAEHLCCDRFNECLPAMGDWMTNWLLHGNTQQVALI